MTTLGNLFFTTEIFLAELIFLYSVPKQEHFLRKYLLSVAVTLLAAGFFPMPEAFLPNPFYQLFRFFFLFGMTIAAMGFCFRLSWAPLFSACVAGYAAQHIAYQVTYLVSHTQLFAEAAQRMRILELITFPLVYLLLFLIFGLFVAKNECHKKTDSRFILLSVIIICICVVLNRFTRYFGEFGNISVSIYTIACCLLGLTIQFILYKMVDLRHENDTIRLLWQEDRKQFEISKKTIDLINIKTHDLKHKLATLKGQLPQEELDSIRETVRIYDCSIKTGNEALDVLLTENSMRCSEAGIRLTYMGNGADFGFMNVMDVYSLFGNAISNAVEAVQELDDPEKRVIDIVSERVGDMINITITNYFSGSRVFEDGLPVTGKREDEGYHGFGMKSMRLITEKYGGKITAQAENQVFSLNIYLLHK
jgi:hypothetical protein